MGFRQNAIIPDFPSLAALDFPHGDGTFEQASGNLTGTAGTCYLTKFWIPKPRTVNAFCANPGVASVVTMGVYREYVSGTLALIGQASKNVAGGTYPQAQRLPPTTPFLVPGGINWLAWLIPTGSTAIAGSCIDTVPGFIAGVCFYLAGMGAALASTIAKSSLVDVATTPARHPGPFTYWDLEFA